MQEVMWYAVRTIQPGGWVAVEGVPFTNVIIADGGRIFMEKKLRTATELHYLRENGAPFRSTTGQCLFLLNRCWRSLLIVVVVSAEPDRITNARRPRLAMSRGLLDDLLYVQVCKRLEWTRFCYLCACLVSDEEVGMIGIISNRSHCAPDRSARDVSQRKIHC